MTDAFALRPLGRDICALIGGQFRLSSQPPTTLHVSLAALRRPRNDETSFKFGQSTQHGDHESSVGRCGVAPRVVD